MVLSELSNSKSYEQFMIYDHRHRVFHLCALSNQIEAQVRKTSSLICCSYVFKTPLSVSLSPLRSSSNALWLSYNMIETLFVFPGTAEKSPEDSLTMPDTL